MRDTDTISLVSRTSARTCLGALALVCVQGWARAEVPAATANPSSPAPAEGAGPSETAPMGPAPSAEAPANAPAGAPAPGTVASPPGKVPVSFVPRRGQRDGVVVKDRQTGESCELPCTLYVDPGDHTFALAHGGPLKTKRFVTVSDGGTTVSVKAGSKPIYWLGAGILWVGVGLLVADQVAGPGSMASTAIAGGVALSGAVMLLPAMPKLRDTGVTPAAGAGPRAGRPRLAVGVGANGGYVTVRAAF